MLEYLVKTSFNFLYSCIVFSLTSCIRRRLKICSLYFNKLYVRILNVLFTSRASIFLQSNSLNSTLSVIITLSFCSFKASTKSFFSLYNRNVSKSSCYIRCFLSLPCLRSYSGLIYTGYGLSRLILFCSLGSYGCS